MPIAGRGDDEILEILGVVRVLHGLDWSGQAVCKLEGLAVDLTSSYGHQFHHLSLDQRWPVLNPVLLQLVVSVYTKGHVSPMFSQTRINMLRLPDVGLT